MWAPATLLYFSVIFERSTLAVIADRLMADFAVGAAGLGLLAGLQLFVNLVMQIPCGTLADVLGPRRLLTAGACLAGLGTLVFADAHGFGVALAARALYSVGDSLVFLNVLRLQAEWFRTREYATMAGLTGFAGGLGGIAATAPMALVVQAIGWRTPVLATGVGFLVVAVLVWTIVRDRPTDIALPAWSTLEPSSPTGAPGRPSRDARDHPAALWRRLQQDLAVVARNPETYYASLSHWALFGPYLLFTTAWGVAYLMQAYGLGRTAAGESVALAGVGALIGGPLVGWLSDRLGRRRTLILVSPSVMLGGWAVFMLPIELPASALRALILAVGLATSGNLLSFAAAKEANPPWSSGLATGFTNLGGFTGGAILPPLFGAILELGWAGATTAGARVYPASAYRMAFGVLVVATLIGMAGTIRMRERRPS